MRLLSLQQKLILTTASAALVWIGLVAGHQRSHSTPGAAAFGAEFLVRPDGYRGLVRHYGFRFSTEPIHMMDGLLYKALSLGAVDVIDAFSTDGRIKAYDLFVLEDDLNFFPPYYAAPLIRSDTLKEYPQLRAVLQILAGGITDEKMQQLNYQVDEQGLSARQVAGDFLQQEGMLPDSAKTASAKKTGAITIGSKEFTEQEILGELLALLVERCTDLKVEKRLNLGGTLICFNALCAGDLDLYPEYTGTGLVNILKQPVESDPEMTYQTVKDQFRQQYDLVWLAPFGFNNTYALTTRRPFAQRHNLRNISDLKQLVQNTVKTNDK